MKTHINITNTELHLIYTMINYDIMLIGTQFHIIAQNNASVRVRSDSKICQKLWIFKAQDKEPSARSELAVIQPNLFIY